MNQNAFAFCELQFPISPIGLEGNGVGKEREGRKRRESCRGGEAKGGEVNVNTPEQKIVATVYSCIRGLIYKTS